MNVNEILELKVHSFDSDEEITIREYLHKLLKTLWNKKEGFNAKRIFGNGGWEHDLCETFIKHGLVKGELDEDGYIDSVDYKTVDAIILNCINEIFRKV